MMFIETEDYRVVCDEYDLDIFTQSDLFIRRKAERIAMEEVASYIRPRYDTDKIFTTEGDDRNAMVLQVTINIALYYMAHWLTGAMALDKRLALYEKAVEWLNKVANGTVIPNLPTY